MSENDKSTLTHGEIVRIGIESDILNGVLLPGDTLDESSLAEKYGVSRTPVREAIANLVQTGLVEKPARHRAHVSQMDTSRLIELFEAISELEGLSARLAAERMTTADKDRLVSTHEEAGAILDQNGDKEAYSAIGRRFHREVLYACRNGALIDMTDTLATRLVPFRRYQVMNVPGRLEQNQKDHDDILAALLAGDADQAYTLMRDHDTRQGETLVRLVALHKLSYAEISRTRSVASELR